MRREWILDLMREAVREQGPTARRIRRLEALAAEGSGATAGERQAARVALDRLKGAAR